MFHTKVYNKMNEKYIQIKMHQEHLHNYYVIICNKTENLIIPDNFLSDKEPNQTTASGTENKKLLLLLFAP